MLDATINALYAKKNTPKKRVNSSRNLQPKSMSSRELSGFFETKVASLQGSLKTWANCGCSAARKNASDRLKIGVDFQVDFG